MVRRLISVKPNHMFVCKDNVHCLLTGYGIIQDNNLTCIYYILKPAPHRLEGSRFDMARTTTNRCLPSIWIWELKTQGGILVFWVLVQVWLSAASHLHNCLCWLIWNIFISASSTIENLELGKVWRGGTRAMRVCCQILHKYVWMTAKNIIIHFC